MEERSVSLRPNYCTSNSEAEAKAFHPARGHGIYPTCYGVFPLEEIEKHPDLCADSCIDSYRVEPVSEGSEHEGERSQ